MKLKSVFLILSLILLPISYAQQNTLPNTAIDSLYKEDQFYLAATYNILTKKPGGVSQSGFSSGFHFGFIKDMPINKMRNKAFGLGLGLSVNNYNQNIHIEKASNNQYNFTVLKDADYTKNRFTTYILEAPLEYRWRTSTPESYRFWRIYTGFKVGYVFANSTFYKGDPKNNKLRSITAFNKIPYGLTLSVGYNTWNVYVYYGLHSVFNTNNINQSGYHAMREIKIGLMFYLL